MHSWINIIFFTGFMGSGKTTIGKITANTLGWAHIDLDEEIEKQVGVSVFELITSKGEETFRILERDILLSFLDRTQLIISLGGGTILYSDNLELIKKAGKLIYISVPPKLLYPRLRYKSNRPLFQDITEVPIPEDEGIKRITEMLQKREPFYRSADLVIEVKKNSLSRTIDETIRSISAHFFKGKQ